MRKVMITVVFVAMAGCQHRCTTGWRFEVLRPPTVDTSSIVYGGPGPLGVAGLGSGPVIHDIAAVTPVAPPVAPPRPTPLSQSFAPVLPSCTLDDVCRRLDALERRSQPLRSPGSNLPMPKGEE